jgi:hypothetical protein
MNGVTKDQIDAMAVRCGGLPREQYRKEALSHEWRKEKPYSKEELAVRRTGRTTTILLAALCKAEETGSSVYLKGVTKEMSLFMRDVVQEMAQKIGVDSSLFQITNGNQEPLFEDHTQYSLP